MSTFCPDAANSCAPAKGWWFAFPGLFPPPNEGPSPPPSTPGQFIMSMLHTRSCSSAISPTDGGPDLLTLPPSPAPPGRSAGSSRLSLFMRRFLLCPSALPEVFRRAASGLCSPAIQAIHIRILLRKNDVARNFYAYLTSLSTPKRGADAPGLFLPF